MEKLVSEQKSQGDSTFTSIKFKRSSVSVSRYTRTIEVTKVNYKTREVYEKDVRDTSGIYASMISQGMEITDLDEDRGKFIVTYEGVSKNK